MPLRFLETLDTILKNTLVVERPKSEPIPLDELVVITCEQHDDLATWVE
jgi:hypothetical protein